jgi:hypothetical protein
MIHNRLVGRSTLLTDELRADVERELAAGVPVAVAAQRVGVGRRTLTRWLERGDVVRRPLAAAPEPVTEVALDDRLAPAEPGLVAVMFQAAQRGSWTAAAWILERRWPARWSRPPQRQADVPPEPGADDPFAEAVALGEARRREVEKLGKR